MRSIKDKNLLENAVAISAQFHANRYRYQEFYDKYADSFSGFPGIWNWIQQAAKAFTDVEATLDKDEFDWIQAIDEYSIGLFELEHHGTKDLKDLARVVLKHAR